MRIKFFIIFPAFVFLSLMASYLLFSLLYLAPISAFPFSSSDNPLKGSCVGDRVSNGDTKFDGNLQRLVTSLSWSAPITGFAQNTSGEAPDKLYGLALCRGDVSRDRCGSCLGGALADVKSACPGYVEAIVFYELCMIRYSRHNFFGTASRNLFNITSGQNASNVAGMNRRVRSFLDELGTRGAWSESRFAADWSKYGKSSKVYAMVQCTRDLAPQTCNSCIRETIYFSGTSFGTKKGAAVYGGSCFVRYDDYPFFDVIAVKGVVSTGSMPNTLAILTAAAVIVVFVFIALILICIRHRRRNKRKAIEKEEEDLNESECLHFSLHDLKIATRGFLDENMVGKGSYGAIYKGILSDGQLIAVKRLLTNSCEGLEELKNEVRLMSKLHHRNLVKLLGYCLQEQEKILVYEYLPNKSLDKVLFDPVRSKELTWDKRVNIIRGIARGLQYLHEDSRMKIVHRDVKAGNILLDDGMHPKIADFGLARTFKSEESHENTMQIAGTHGYIAPEYMDHGEVSAKSDVYSFGVLVMETVSGKKYYDFFCCNTQIDLIRYISWLWEEGNPLSILDYKIRDGAPASEVLNMIKIGLLCVQHSPRRRPTMSMVFQLLKSDTLNLSIIPQSLGFDARDDTINPMPRKINKQWKGNEIEFIVTENTLLEPR